VTHANPATLEPLDRDLWVATRPLRLVVGDVGARMTVMRLADGALLLHSPVALDAQTRDALDALGHVAWVVAPSKVHHFYVGDYASAYPSALVIGVPGLPEKRRDLRFDALIGEGWTAPWGGEVRIERFAGAPRIGEVVFLHVPTRTLVLTDLAFHVRSDAGPRARLFHWVVGATDRFGPHRLVRAMIRDREAARRSVGRILEWDFDRVIVSHGEVLESGGHAAFEAAFSYLDPAAPPPT
jgi:hypothetical protein